MSSRSMLGSSEEGDDPFLALVNRGSILGRYNRLILA
jgi:hypothetical protein